MPCTFRGHVWCMGSCWDVLWWCGADGGENKHGGEEAEEAGEMPPEK